jgi:uncharacterized repeat protein (TIGR01451 family)
MIRASCASLLLALTLAACGGSDGAPPAGSNADLAVAVSGATEVNAGETMTFRLTVVNEGPAAATGVTLNHHLDGAPATSGMACTATGGASCPAELGDSMTVDALPVGGGLVFIVTVPGAADLIGPVTSSMTVEAAADIDHTNNIGEATTVALDLRNGDYTAFASNGRQYTLTLNFNAMTYSMVGAQLNVGGLMTRDANGIDYVFGGTGTARFRMASGLVVGGFEFLLNGSDHVYDKGVRPFVASRDFSTDIASLAGKSFNLLGLNLRRNDNIESVVSPATFDAGALQVCGAPAPVRVAVCPANFLVSYALTVSGSDIRGVNVADKNDVLRFRLARTATGVVLLRAEDAADATGRQFRVGLPETVGLTDGAFAASNTHSAWGTMTVTDSSYAFAGAFSDGSAVDETSVLSPLNLAAPTGLRRGLRSGDSTPIYVAQSDPLVLMLGEKDGAAEDTMGVGLH